MSKITKKSVNALMDIYKNQNPDVVLKLTNPSNKDEVVMEISVKTDLSIPEKGIFVDRVVNSCFDVDGDFMPQYLDPVFIITLLQMTTNVPVYEQETKPILANGEESPTTVKVLDIEKTYSLCKAINLVHNVKDDRYQALVADLKGMVEAKLDYMKEVNAKKTSNMIHVLQPLLESFSDVLESNKPMEVLNDNLRQLDKEMDKVVALPTKK